MRISDWSSDVCSSDLGIGIFIPAVLAGGQQAAADEFAHVVVGLADALVYLALASTDLFQHGVVGVARVFRGIAHGLLLIKPWVWLLLASRTSLQARKSVGQGKWVSGCVDFGGRPVLKKKMNRL